MELPADFLSLGRGSVMNGQRLKQYLGRNMIDS